jgi:hypothetical protein
MRDYRSGLVPKETKAKNIIIGSISFARLIGLFIALAVASAFQPYVNSNIQTILFISFPLFFWILSGKDPVNPTKIFAQGLSSYLQNLMDPKQYLSIIGAAYQKSQEEKEREAKNNET